MNDVVMVVDARFGQTIIDGARRTMEAHGVRLQLVSPAQAMAHCDNAESMIVPARCPETLSDLAEVRDSGQANFVLIATMAPGDVERFRAVRELGLDGVALEDENLGTDLLLRIELASSRESECGTAVERYRQLERECRDLLGLMHLSQAASAAQDADEVLRSTMRLWHNICASGYLAYWEWRGGNEARWELLAELAAGAMVVKPGRDERPGDADDSRVGSRDRVRLVKRPWEDPTFLRWAPSWRVAEGSELGRAALVDVSTPLAARGLLVLGDISRTPTPLLGREPVLRSLGSQVGGAMMRAHHHGEVDRAYQELKNTQRQLVHAEKFAAMGLLSAEIAHEINNPASFVISNLSVLDEYTGSLTEYIDEAERLILERAPLVSLELRALQE